MTSGRFLKAGRRRRKTGQALALRSRIVLACADDHSVTEVAAELGISRATAGKWRSRFLEGRLEGLSDEPRPGRPRTITGEHVEKVIAATLPRQQAARSASARFTDLWPRCWKAR